MQGIQTWGEAITMALINLWERFISFIPLLVGAILVFLIGLGIAVAMGKLIANMLKASKIDRAVDKLGIKKRLEDMGLKTELSVFIGQLVKWFLVLVFLMAATDILKLNQVSDFLNSIILYIPNVVVAVIILTVVVLLGNFVYNLVKGSVRAAGVVSATMLATISKWSIIIFGVFAAMIQLGIASSLVSTIFIGIVAMLALAGGLAFGLGGKDEAQLILRKLREELTIKEKTKK